MVQLPGGTFLMGSEAPYAWPEDGEGPVREVTVEPFAISPTAVTNAEFAAFIADTAHVTEAERYGWSFVFHLYLNDTTGYQRALAAPWWVAVTHATWEHPEGPDSTYEGREDHPVVHVAHTDALAYCAWSHTRLPTEAEWEYAARGGLTQQRYPWGDELTTPWPCNIWQGTFPDHDTGEDGYRGTAPATAYEPNAYGLHNMVGNVWEWTAEPVTRGGSYLCHDSYCNRYRTSARNLLHPASSTGNVGFRVAR
ncbi:formylglycine-generating enzyme family protein [Solirubrobacter phytolaccae]|uniref:Formylglycine-generating enzyme family protein n=1 Tax=Solirubrobacter phytolaccae TaxID=1404360 RepID=A0A9X3NEM7_9ACTN|nr:formylglycine-generating enzyme family protein [Solirubrobacter phytolaccae]MDA0185083.1 formylglycine-generating enzyme family protein [Solirubrobacter phytolaccae]